MSKPRIHLTSVVLGALLAAPLTIVGYRAWSRSVADDGPDPSDPVTDKADAARVSVAPLPERGSGPADVAPAASVEQLRAGVRRLERELAREQERLDRADPGAKERARAAFTARLYEPTEEQVQGFADRCAVKYPILPESAHGSPDPIPPDWIERAALDERERGVLDGLFAELNEDYARRVRGLYTEISGNDSSDLSLRAMAMEITDKAGDASMQARARQEITSYRAGRSTTLPSQSDNAMTRLLDAYYRRADDFRDRLAAAVGPERAREIRETLPSSAWGEHGCPDPDN